LRAADAAAVKARVSSPLFHGTLYFVRMTWFQEANGAQIANATPGKSSAGLVDYLTALVKTKLDPFVANHKLSSAQEATILARVQTKVTTLVNRHH
jgi:hypothetical protein